MRPSGLGVSENLSPCHRGASPHNLSSSVLRSLPPRAPDSSAGHHVMQAGPGPAGPGYGRTDALLRAASTKRARERRTGTRSAPRISKHTDIAYRRSRFELLSYLVALEVHAEDIEPESASASARYPVTASGASSCRAACQGGASLSVDTPRRNAASAAGLSSMRQS
jgi:hypothetical protein